MRKGGVGSSAAKSAKFFYLTIKYGNREQIVHMFNRMGKDAEVLTDGIISLVYYMRGAVSYEEMWRRTPFERERFSSFLDKRFEVEKKNPHPVY